MIKHLAPVILAAAAATAASAETRTVEVGDFTGLHAANGVEVEVTLGQPVEVVVDGPRNEIDRVRVFVDDDVLHVRPERSGWFQRDHLRDTTVRVSAESLSSVRVANGAIVSLEGAGGSDLEVDVVNGGVLEATGACGALEAEAHRGGVAELSALDCQSATVEASMGGVLRVRASGSVDASASMGGVIETLGDSDSYSAHASMGGVVSRADPGDE